MNKAVNITEATPKDIAIIRELTSEDMIVIIHAVAAKLNDVRMHREHRPNLLSITSEIRPMPFMASALQKIILGYGSANSSATVIYV
jgi:hypothetical protein